MAAQTHRTGPATLRPGRANSLSDVAGIRAGHAQRTGAGWRTGVTVVLAADDGMTCGADVRGGAPGTRETDLLDPRNRVEQAQAIVLTGGSAYGLAAVDGVVTRLADAGIGHVVGTAPGEVVPIVPAAVIFDLGRGGVFRATPDAALGAAAYDAALRPGRIGQGSVGAGTGAVTGGFAGGAGMASVVLPDGTTVAALAIVNSFGSPVDPATGELYGARFGLAGEFASLSAPGPADVAAWLSTAESAHGRVPGVSGRENAPPSAARPDRAGHLEPEPRQGSAAQGDDPDRPPGPPVGAAPFNTTIGLLATDARLTKAQCARLAGSGHDGLARAIRPAHTMLDGDTIFALASWAGEPPGLDEFQLLLITAADTFSRAITHAVLAAAGRPGAPSYLDVFPSARQGP